MKNGAWFPYFLGALLLVSVGSNVYLIVRAHDDPSFAVEPDYYAKAVHWDESQAARAASASLGWRATVAATHDGVEVELSDEQGRPLEGAEVGLVAFHNARAKDRLSTFLEPTAPGRYAVKRRLERPGIWEIRLSAQRGEDRFLHVAREELP